MLLETGTAGVQPGLWPQAFSGTPSTPDKLLHWDWEIAVAGGEHCW